MLIALTAGVLLTGRRRFLEDGVATDRTVQE